MRELIRLHTFNRCSLRSTSRASASLIFERREAEGLASQHAGASQGRLSPGPLRGSKDRHLSLHSVCGFQFTSCEYIFLRAPPFRVDKS